MSLPFAIEQRLPRADLAAFHELAAHRSFTIESAMAWLQERGYRCSHGATANYMRHLRDKRPFPLPPIPGIDTDAAARRQIAIWRMQLSGDDLYRLALTAFYLVEIRAAGTGELDQESGGDFE